MCASQIQTQLEMEIHVKACLFPIKLIDMKIINNILKIFS